MNTLADDVLRKLSQPLPIDELKHYSQQRAYAGDVLYTEGMPCNHMYVIKEGEVDIYMVREEKRVVIDTLGRGQCFGMTPQLLNGRRTTNAVARSYCEFYLVDLDSLDDDLAATPRLIRGILDTLARRVSRAGELIATRVNYQPELLVYAQLLQLLGQGEAGAARKGQRTAGTAERLVSVALPDVFAYGRNLLGHSDVHIRSILGKLLMLHLVQVDDDTRDGGKRLRYAPLEIVARARKVAGSETEQGKLDFEYISVDEFAELVEVERGQLLKKLARDEFSQELFTFRKSEVLRLLDLKGRKFFVERKIKHASEFADVEDLEFADQKSLVEVLAKVDALDLARMLQGHEDEALRGRILGCLPRAKREEVESEIGTFGNLDPVEVTRIGKSLVAQVQEKMLQR